MSNTAIAYLAYGIPISSPEIYDWEVINCKDFDPPPMHGCETLLYGNANVELNYTIVVSVTKREVYAGDIEEINPLDLSSWEQREGWNTDLTRVLLDLGLSYKKPSWMLLCFTSP